MEDERESTRYWCHECSRVVDPIMEVESIECSLCHGGFVEEMDSIRSDNHRNHQPHEGGADSDRADSDRALSLWAPILLGMMSNPRRRRRFRQLEFDEENEEEHRRDPEDRGGSDEHSHQGGEPEVDRELESLRRRRSSAAILHLLQGIRAGMVPESENNGEGGGDNNRERVILINPFNQTIIVHGGGGNLFDPSNPSQNHHPIGSFGDYFVGPGLELLLQHLAENDPNRYGTPPAKKQAVEAMPTVKIEDNSIQCSVCLEDFEIGTEARQMPCNHRFHGDCILPWLELHSSCPVCRYQLAADESKINREREGSRGSVGNSNGVAGESENGRNGGERQFSVSLPWPFSSWFSSTSGSNMENLNSSLTTTASSSGGSESSPRAHEGDRSSRGEDDH